MTAISFPPAFEEYMRNHLDTPSWNSFLVAHAASSPVSIRINPFKSNLINAGEKIPWTAFGYYLKERPIFTLDPLFHAGAYYVQEASSMFLEQAIKQIIPLDQPLHVLDLCAAPGGKSTHIISLLNKNSLLVSNEVIRSRVNVLGENLQKWGSNNVIVTHNDAHDFSALEGMFDVIIIDAPCSGEGLFRKDPSAMKSWSPENIEHCSARQKRILNDVWPALKESGILIYSTCTYNTSENEENLSWLQQHKEVEFIPLILNDKWRVEEVKKDNAVGYRLYPHTVKGEGFFLAAARKLEKTYPVKNKISKPVFNSPSKKIMQEINSWLINPEEKTFIQRENTIQFFPTLHTSFIEQVIKPLRINYAGTFLGTVKHDKIIPEHALALSNELCKENFFTVSLSRDHALQYLRKETISLDVPHKGFALAVYNNLPLGWMNIIPGRINNLYPQEWRIRMSG